VPFERFPRPRDQRGFQPAPAAVSVTGRGALILNRKALDLLGDTEFVQYAVDESDNAFALIPAAKKDVTYRVSRKQKQKQASLSAVEVIRRFAIAPGKYRATTATVFGKTCLVFHYARYDIIPKRTS
jgi:hypothetical protein